MKREQIAAAFIHEGHRYYLQYRNGAKQKGELGKTGLFGGKVEKGESAQEAVYREVAQEEARFSPPVSLEDFEYKPENGFTLDTHRKWLGIFRQRVRINVEVFELELAAGTKVEALEGTLIQLNGDDEVAEVGEGGLSPVAKKFFDRRIGNGSEHHES